jgi:hypothetical protein
MKFDDFKNKFYCVFSIEETNENTLIVNTKIKRRNDNVVIDQVYTKIDIQSTNQWINDSQSIISISEWNWEKLIEQTKRIQLDYFAQRALIEDYYPLNSENEIEDMYQN